MDSALPSQKRQKRLHPGSDSDGFEPVQKRICPEAQSSAVSIGLAGTVAESLKDNNAAASERLGPAARSALSADNPPSSSSSSTNAVNRLDFTLRISLDIASGDNNVAICDRLWFPDGNLVIWAVSPTEMRLFNVHVAVLWRFSKVFKREVVPGIPSGRWTLQTTMIASLCNGPRFVVKLEDHPDEVEYFLYAMYEKMSLDQLAPLSMDAVLAIIKLGYKYDAKAIAKDVVARILGCRLEVAGVKKNHESGDAGGETDAGEDGGSGQGQAATTPPVLWDSDYAIPLANLAHVCGLKNVLPLALYACYQRGRQYVIDGVTLADGAYKRLDNALVAKVTADSVSFGDPVNGCVPSRHAKTCWKDFKYPPEPQHSVEKTHPIGTLEDWRSFCLNREMCSWCIGSVESRYKKQIQHYFAKVIPEAFGLL